MENGVTRRVSGHPEVCVHRSNPLNNPDLFEDMMELDTNNYEQEISDSEAEHDLQTRLQPDRLWRLEHSGPTAKSSIIKQLYSDVVHVPKQGRQEVVPVQNVTKVTRSASVQDSGTTLLFNRTLLLFSQLHLWIAYLCGVVLPATRSYASQLAPEAIVSNIDIVITYLIRVLCYLYLQIKLIIQEELTRWTSVFLCAVWESLMRLSAYR